MAQAVFAETGTTLEYFDRHDDRAAAGRHHRRLHRRGRRFLQLRHQRPEPRRCSACRATTPASFLPAYVEQGILEKDPFVSLDVEGMGAMVASPPRAAAPRPGLKLGASAASMAATRPPIAFCNWSGSTTSRAAPTACAVARLAAAQAALQGGDRTA